jgi:hypothetical protein
MTRTRTFCLVACTALAGAMTIGAATLRTQHAARRARRAALGHQPDPHRVQGPEQLAHAGAGDPRLPLRRWSYARNKNMDCNKDRPGRTWHCRAIASPCAGRAIA